MVPFVDPVLANPCREESCPRDDLHASHEVAPRRGRTPRSCPRCLGHVAGQADEGAEEGVCTRCGWSRATERAPSASLSGWRRPAATAPARPSASAWVRCPRHASLLCDTCGGTGLIPRLRLSLLLGAAPVKMLGR